MGGGATRRQLERAADSQAPGGAIRRHADVPAGAIIQSPNYRFADAARVRWRGDCRSDAPPAARGDDGRRLHAGGIVK